LYSTGSSAQLKAVAYKAAPGNGLRLHQRKASKSWDFDSSCMAWNDKASRILQVIGCSRILLRGYLWRELPETMQKLAKI
jgi:hypothetical protein